MGGRIFSLVPEERFREVLENFHDYTGLRIQLIDSEGVQLLSFGKPANYCCMLQKNAFDSSRCCRLHMQAARCAQSLGESYIFSCHGNLNNIAFPLLIEEELLGSIIIGPFLIGQADSTIVSDVAEEYDLSAALSLDLFEELEKLNVYSPARVSKLKKLIDHLLSPMLPGERALLLQNQQKMLQQAQLNETIQFYKEENAVKSLNYLYSKERELLAKVRSGTITEVKGLLNDLIGYVLFSEGGKKEMVRVRAMELTTLLSRVAIDGGARTDSTYQMNSQFLSRLLLEQDMENLCMLMQEVLESFMKSMFSDTDKGNPYIRKALRFMADNYSEDLHLDQVAEYVELSPSYFSSLFHQVVGVSFREQLCRIRVEESKQLLLSRKYALADIAVSMGFPDQSYYSKVFKRIVGVSPGKYRP